MKKDRSAFVSLVSVGVLSAVLAALAVFAPALVSAFIEHFDRPERIYLPIVVTFYAILPFAAGVLICLWKLLFSPELLPFSVIQPQMLFLIS